MGRKSGSTRLKRLAAPRAMPVKRKTSKWVSKPKPGPHAGNESVSLVSILRDVLKLTGTSREAEKIVARGDVIVDGRVVKEPRFPIGLMDVVSIPKAGKSYRVLVDSKSRILLNEVGKEQTKYKLCKLLGKQTVKKGKTQLALHDGRTLLSNEQHATGTTLKISVPEGKVLEALKIEKGAKCFVTKGTHAGVVAELVEVTPGTATRDAEAKMKSENGEFMTVLKYLFVVGNELQ
ncbi:30S ribosomal protein S4e [Candidatus Micrarchaeota archaeon]|nr:30S ribosomal protein S4e [Candidatus Micrarchaeota archaeon]